MKKYDLFFGYFGNGCTISNRAVRQYGDYKKVCHISDDGETITIYDKSIPAEVMERIRAYAEKMKAEYKAKQEADRIAKEKHAEWLKNRMNGTDEQPKAEEVKPETVKVKIEMFVDIEADKMEELKRIEHHAEYLLNLEEYPEIKTVYGVKVTEAE